MINSKNLSRAREMMVFQDILLQTSLPTTAARSEVATESVKTQSGLVSPTVEAESNLPGEDNKSERNRIEGYDSTVTGTIQGVPDDFKFIPSAALGGSKRQTGFSHSAMRGSDAGHPSALSSSPTGTRRSPPRAARPGGSVFDNERYQGYERGG
ncbi:uncharacterized protein I206_100490 [Kwoniella pini CBS 10737]|uniref:Uncharacterized protein n=1 Tax=Kwoniella pini CBS 10737 TaxID=1296096 RepID=A0AAJ8KZZ3_9TREE